MGSGKINKRGVDKLHCSSGSKKREDANEIFWEKVKKFQEGFSSIEISLQKLETFSQSTVQVWEAVSVNEFIVGTIIESKPVRVHDSY